MTLDEAQANLLEEVAAAVLAGGGFAQLSLREALEAFKETRTAGDSVKPVEG